MHESIAKEFGIFYIFAKRGVEMLLPSYVGENKRVRFPLPHDMKSLKAFAFRRHYEGMSPLNIIAVCLGLISVGHVLKAQHSPSYAVECVKGTETFFKTTCPDFRSCSFLMLVGVEKLKGDVRLHALTESKDARSDEFDLGLLAYAEDIPEIELALPSEEERLMVNYHPARREMRIKLRDASIYEVLIAGQKGLPLLYQKAEKGAEVKISLPEDQRYVVIAVEGNKVWSRIIPRQ